MVPLRERPDLTAIAGALPERYPYLLESAAGGPLDRFSLLLRASGETLRLNADGSLEGPGAGPGFLDRLDAWYRAERLPDAPSIRQADETPFVGGWFLYLGYELAGEIEPSLDLPAARDGLPVALAARCDGAILLRHGEADSAALIAEKQDVLERMTAELAGIDRDTTASLTVLDELSAEPAEDFRRHVRTIQEYLLAGDVFQVNLSRGWRGHFTPEVDPVRMYRALRAANPSPFGGLMLHGDLALLSSSPERLVEIDGRNVQTRPIAGTHPRGKSPEEDEALSRQMLAHPKEQAEHIMLIDLERNDLGRVCKPGSVEVDELMVLETYAHVHHIVSNVRGMLREGVSPIDVIRAVFPGGTITGCPKVRCMEIIAELEGQGRGFYTGSMGYLDRRGRMDLNILIRSMLVGPESLSFRTGAGIVADSDPDREVAETLHKARGLLAALGGSSLRSEEVN
ncbi:MAG: aminodeoxychorismate synthase component I [Xanthomonadales bacterium]|nr:aminodeoxychorismate synthase component I [Xanthomonadales bacterium]